jgi:hypothetical protein
MHSEDVDGVEEADEDYEEYEDQVLDCFDSAKKSQATGRLVQTAGRFKNNTYTYRRYANVFVKNILHVYGVALYVHSILYAKRLLSQSFVGSDY